MIGGDMETAGVIDACLRNSKPCVFIKGICDWGYDKNTEGVNKEKDQMKAATNAFQLIIEAVASLA